MGDLTTSDNKRINEGDALRELLESIKQNTDGTYYIESIDTLHQLTHDKKMHTISYTKESVAAAGTLLVRIVASANKDAHVRITFSGEGKTRLRSYTQATYTANGTLYTPFNRQTIEPNNLECTVYIDPTVNVIGPRRGNDFVGSAGAGARAGGSGDGNLETIINAGTELLIEVVNGGAVSSDLGCIVNLYERNKIE